MMKKWYYWSAILVVAFLSGITDGWSEAVGFDQGAIFTIVPLAINLFLTFGWLGIDSHEVGYNRSNMMNLGIVLVTPIFLPIYLAKSRPIGQRLKPSGYFVLFLAGWFAATLAGFMLGYVLAA